MKSNLIKNTLKGIGLSAFLAAGLIAFTGTEANAQYRDRDDQQDRRDRRDDRDSRRDDGYYDQDNRGDRNRNQLYRVARENGFSDGQDAARDDRNDRDRNDARRSREYRKATNGYYDRLGNKNAYKDAYRQAFLQGYESVNNRRNRRDNRRNGY